MAVEDGMVCVKWGESKQLPLFYINQQVSIDINLLELSSAWWQ